MGAGHDAVAAELARRMEIQKVETSVLDVLDLVPLKLGRGLRRMYSGMVRSAPWLYEGIYRAFFVPHRPLPASPLTALIARRLDARIRELPPDAVVSTFHVAAQAAGRLRDSGRLTVPSLVLVTDFAVHRMWLHAGNDRYLCPDERSARTVMERTGRPAGGHAPVVRPEFRRKRAAGDRLREAAGARPDDKVVLISAGSWGVGRVVETAQGVAASGRYVPVVLCGRNERLRERVYGPALGWRDDMAELMAGAYALIDNAAGLTCREAFACGLPVISYRPIPGHGRDGAAAMARAGLSRYARTPGELVGELDRLKDDAERRTRARTAAGLLRAAPAERVIQTALG